MTPRAWRSASLSRLRRQHCNEPKHVAKFVHDVVRELETIPTDKDNLVVVDFDADAAHGLCYLVRHFTRLSHQAKAEVCDVLCRVAGNGAVGLLFVFCCCHY